MGDRAAVNQGFAIGSIVKEDTVGILPDNSADEDIPSH